MILFTVTSASEIIIVHRKLDFVFFSYFRLVINVLFLYFRLFAAFIVAPSHAMSVRSSEWEK